MSIENFPEECIIFDTEYTAWEGSHERGWNREGEYKELVQIGAIRVSHLKEVDSFLCYVRPERNPLLSEYFIKLTGITQQDLEEKGISFEEARDTFIAWSKGIVTYSYGNDVNILLCNEALQSLPSTIIPELYKDVRDIFASHGIPVKDYSSGTIPKAFGVTPPPHAHDALNDARSILLGLQQL